MSYSRIQPGREHLRDRSCALEARGRTASVTSRQGDATLYGYDELSGIWR
jgi:hypothetical protein